MKLDDIRKLQQKKYRAAFGCFVAEGEHLVLELQNAALREPRLRASQLYVTQVYATQAPAGWHGEFAVHVIDDRQFAHISDTQTPQGILAVVPILPPQPARDGERAIYLHEVQDPGNLGTILRTLAWFGGFRCLLGPGSVDPYNAKVVRSSMGGLFHVPIEVDVELSSLRDRFSRIACLDMSGERTATPGFADFDCCIFGNEARGVPRDVLREWPLRTFAIDGGGAVESLNLASVVNMCVYEMKR